MRYIVRSVCCFMLSAGIATAQSASEPREALLVSTAWLAQHLNDRDLVVLFVGDDNEYNKAHIPGTYNVQMEDMVANDTSSTGLSVQLLPPEQLSERLGAFGITPRSRIVVTGGRGFQEWASRVMLTLDYAGLGNRASLLDGGTAAWAKENRPMTDVVPAKHRSTLGVLETKPVVVTADYVKAHIGTPGVVIVDARAAAFYDGVSTGGGRARPHRTGHIAGAKNIPYSSLFNENSLRPTPELRSIFTAAGVAPTDTVVAYCHIGVQATAVLLAARVLGHPVRFYDGSFEDWSRQPPAEYPVEKSLGREKP